MQNLAKFLATIWQKIESAELCKGVHCVDLGESLHAHYYMHNLASIKPRTSPIKFAWSSGSAAPPRDPRTELVPNEARRHVISTRKSSLFWMEKPLRLFKTKCHFPHWDNSVFLQSISIIWRAAWQSLLQFQPVWNHKVKSWNHAALMKDKQNKLPPCATAIDSRGVEASIRRWKEQKSNSLSAKDSGSRFAKRPCLDGSATQRGDLTGRKQREVYWIEQGGKTRPASPCGGGGPAGFAAEAKRATATQLALRINHF